MFRRVRGRAVIINNKHFVESEARYGCEKDVADLQKLFAALHFEVILHEDRTGEVITVTSFSSRCLLQRLSQHLPLMPSYVVCLPTPRFK